MQTPLMNNYCFELNQAQECYTCGYEMQPGHKAVLYNERHFCCYDCAEEFSPRRTHYNNGLELSTKTGLCDDCAATVINGALCHEHNCPSSWKDKQIQCSECGFEFYPTDRSQRLCDDCLADTMFEELYGSHDRDGDVLFG